MDTVVLIPAYKPDEKFIRFIERLVGMGLSVLAVDDGSGDAYAEIFNKAEALGVRLVHHDVNKGKGRALKTGFAVIAESMPEVAHIVTADCDGQHTPEDICRVIDSMAENPDCMIIGGRFSKKDDEVPIRSRIGNGITRYAFRIVTGLKIRDTQTGLRGIPSSLIPKLLKLNGERYEYEMNMLLYLKEWEVRYKEIPIATVYIDNNEGSHYNTFRDSWRVFVQIFKFCLSALASFAVDYTLFILLDVFVFAGDKWNLASLLGDSAPAFLGRVIACCSVSYIIARVISAVVNYMLNRRVVFKKGSKYSVLKYFLLAFAVMLIGAFFTGLLLDTWGVPGVLCKLIVDMPIAVANYFIQRDWVFRKKK